MLKRRLTGLKAGGAEERGFTLVELLVVMVAGMVVASALFTILDVTLHQTTRTFSRVDATQRARTALETIENEMHSACVENRVTPIIKNSTATSVSFWSQYGSGLSSTPGVSLTPIKHTISFDSASGNLTDATYAVTGGEALNWVASTTATQSETLLTNVAQSGSTPVFQYSSLDPTAPSPLPPPLSETNSERTTGVQMTLVVKPAGGSGEDTNLVPNTVTNSVLLRLTPVPNPGTPNQDFQPCE